MPEWSDVTAMQGGHELSLTMLQMWDDGKLKDLDDLAIAVTESWTRARLPLLSLPRKTWVGFFRITGFIVDGRRDEPSRPPKPILLYRAGGALDHEEPGLAWTPDLDNARFFAEHNLAFYGFESSIMRTTASPGQFLARFASTRDEDEYLAIVEPDDVEWIE
jgi:hypothetical protein